MALLSNVPTANVPASMSTQFFPVPRKSFKKRDINELVLGQLQSGFYRASPDFRNGVLSESTTGGGPPNMVEAMMALNRLQKAKISARVRQNQRQADRINRLRTTKPVYRGLNAENFEEKQKAHAITTGRKVRRPSLRAMRERERQTAFNIEQARARAAAAAAADESRDRRDDPDAETRSEGERNARGAASHDDADETARGGRGLGFPTVASVLALGMAGVNTAAQMAGTAATTASVIAQTPFGLPATLTAGMMAYDAADYELNRATGGLFGLPGEGEMRHHGRLVDEQNLGWAAGMIEGMGLTSQAQVDSRQRAVDSIYNPASERFDVTEPFSRARDYIPDMSIDTDRLTSDYYRGGNPSLT